MAGIILDTIDIISSEEDDEQISKFIEQDEEDENKYDSLFAPSMANKETTPPSKDIQSNCVLPKEKQDSLLAPSEVKAENTMLSEGIQNNHDLPIEIPDPSLNSAQLGYDFPAEVKSALLSISRSSSSSSLPSLSGIVSCGDMSFQERCFLPNEQKKALDSVRNSACKSQLDESYSSDSNSNLSLSRSKRPSSPSSPSSSSEPPSKKVCTDVPLEISVGGLAPSCEELQTEGEIEQEKPVESPVVLNGGEECKRTLKEFIDEGKRFCCSMSRMLRMFEFLESNETEAEKYSESYLQSSGFENLLDKSLKKMDECFNGIFVCVNDIFTELKENGISCNSLTNNTDTVKKHSDFASAASLTSISEENTSCSSVKDRERHQSEETRLTPKELDSEMLPAVKKPLKRVALKRCGPVSSKLKEPESNRHNLKKASMHEHQREKYQSVECAQVEPVPTKCQPDNFELKKSEFEHCVPDGELESNRLKEFESKVLKPEESELQNNEPEEPELRNKENEEPELSNKENEEAELQNDEVVEHEPGASGSDEEDPRNNEEIKRIEFNLGRLHKQIEKFRNMELKYDDLDRADSSYIREDKFVKMFTKLYKKYCHKLKQSTNTKRPIQKKFLYKGSRYPEVNKAIEDLINKHRLVPDSYDIFKTIEKVNNEEGLRIPNVERLAKKVFQEVMNELSERRRRDVDKHLFELLPRGPCIDPIRDDDEVARLLKESRMKCEEKIQAIIDDYAERKEVSPVVNSAVNSEEESDNQDAEESGNEDAEEFYDQDAEESDKGDANVSGNQVDAEEDDDDDDDDDLLGLGMNRY